MAGPAGLSRYRSSSRQRLSSRSLLTAPASTTTSPGSRWRRHLQPAGVPGPLSGPKGPMAQAQRHSLDHGGGTRHTPIVVADIALARREACGSIWHQAALTAHLLVLLRHTHGCPMGPRCGHRRCPASRLRSALPRRGRRAAPAYRPWPAIPLPGRRRRSRLWPRRWRRHTSPRQRSPSAMARPREARSGDPQCGAARGLPAATGGR